MLARVYSLSGAKSFAKVLKEGKYKRYKNFAIRVLNRNDKEFSRFGFVVSLKVAKEATRRNRVRRALAGAVRYLYTKVKRGYDVVFLATSAASKASTDEMALEARNAIFEMELIEK